MPQAGRKQSSVKKIGDVPTANVPTAARLLRPPRRRFKKFAERLFLAVNLILLGLTIFAWALCHLRQYDLTIILKSSTIEMRSMTARADCGTIWLIRSSITSTPRFPVPLAHPGTSWTASPYSGWQWQSFDPFDISDGATWNVVRIWGGRWAGFALGAYAFRSSDLAESPDSSISEFGVSLWVTAAALGLFPLVVFGRWKKRRRWRRRGQCQRCGYDLRATPRRCPECGAACQATRTAD